MNANHIFTIGLDTDELAEALEDAIDTSVDRSVGNIGLVTSDSFDQHLGDCIDSHLDEYVTDDDLAGAVKDALDDSDYCDEDKVREIVRDECSDMKYDILYDRDLAIVIDKRVALEVQGILRTLLGNALANLDVVRSME